MPRKVLEVAKSLFPKAMGRKNPKPTCDRTSRKLKTSEAERK
jgi:hypothetical protein